MGGGVKYQCPRVVYSLYFGSLGSNSIVSRFTFRTKSIVARRKREIVQRTLREKRSRQTLTAGIRPKYLKSLHKG